MRTSRADRDKDDSGRYGLRMPDRGRPGVGARGPTRRWGVSFSTPRYVTDVTYMPTFTANAAPAWFDLVALLSAIEPPARRAGFGWCELGCGQGTTAAILAATH